MSLDRLRTHCCLLMPFKPTGQRSLQSAAALAEASQPSSVEPQRIRDLVVQARHIVLVTHLEPDGDAIGSLLALGQLLRMQGKELTLTCQDPVPELYAWLPGSGTVVGRASKGYDLVISLDCSDERRLGQVFDGSRSTSAPLVNIDHHVTNTRFGSVNLVDPSSVATAQMVLGLADIFGWEVTPDVAVCLLTGLVTDTRGFRTANVDAVVMRAALRLVETGASLGEIAQRTLDQRPLAMVRLWGDAFTQLHLECDILWTEVTRAMSQRWSLGVDGTTGLSNFLSGVREAKVVAVFFERDDGAVDVGLRAAPGHDVAQVALRLGGGGHPLASGCTLQGSLQQVRERVLAELRRGLEEQR